MKRAQVIICQEMFASFNIFQAPHVEIGACTQFTIKKTTATVLDPFQWTALLCCIRFRARRAQQKTRIS